MMWMYDNSLVKAEINEMVKGKEEKGGKKAILGE
jgi:hypothetical protein